MSATENNSIWLSREINSKNTIISSFMFAIGVQKTITFLKILGFGRILCHFSYCSTSNQIQIRKTKVFHHEMERAHIALHLAEKYAHLITIWRSCVLPDDILCWLPKKLQNTLKLGEKKKKKGLVPGSEEVFHCCSFNVGLFFFSAYLVGLWISEHMGFSNLSWCNSWSQNYFLIQMETRKSYKGLLKSSFCISTRHKTTCSLVAKPQLITIITR